MGNTGFLGVYLSGNAVVSSSVTSAFLETNRWSLLMNSFTDIYVLSPHGSPPFTSELTCGLSILAITVVWYFMCASSFRRATCARCSRPTSGRCACHQRPHFSNSYIFMREYIYDSQKKIFQYRPIGWWSLGSDITLRENWSRPISVQTELPQTKLATYIQEQALGLTSYIPVNLQYIHLNGLESTFSCRSIT